MADRHERAQTCDRRRLEQQLAAQVQRFEPARILHLGVRRPTFDPALRTRPVRAQAIRHAVAERPAQQAGHAPTIVVAARDAERAFGCERRIVGADRDRAGQRIAPLQSALRTAQDFDLLRIPQHAVTEHDFVVAHRPAIELHVQASTRAGDERIAALRRARAIDTANRGRDIAGADIDDVRNRGEHILGRVQSGAFFELVRVKHDGAGRRVHHRASRFFGDHVDGRQFGGVLRSLRRCSGRFLLRPGRGRFHQAAEQRSAQQGSLHHSLPTDVAAKPSPPNR